MKPLPGRLGLAAAIVLAGVATASAQSLEHTRFEPLWLEPALAGGMARPAGYTVPALLNFPPGWATGDAAAIVVSDGPWADPGWNGLVAALLDAGAAVLELDVNAARGFAVDSGKTGPALSRRDLLPDVFAALLALRRDAGAGLVIAIGRGEAGEAALLAATEGAAAHHLGASGPRLAAAVAFGPGQIRFAGGAPMPAAEDWPHRARLLCETLRGAAGSLTAGFLEPCAGALLHPGATATATARYQP